MKRQVLYIDIILTNNEHKISNWEVFPLSLSDHDCVGYIWKKNHQKYQPRTIRIRNYSKYDPKEFCKQEKIGIVNTNNVNSVKFNVKSSLLGIL